MEYAAAVEPFAATYDEIEPLYRAHYAEMQERLAGDGIDIGPYAPQLDRYRTAASTGYLVTYILRTAVGEAVGYCNLYVAPDMHSSEPIASEDTIFVRRDHRNGAGRKFAKLILADLRSRGVRRLNVVALTDLRVAKLWKRMGFRETGVAMTYIF